MKYERKAAHTRQQIIDSFLNSLSERNFESITIDTIVKPIFLNRSTFYRYFDDKYDLLKQVEQQILQDIGQQFDSRSDFPDDDMINQIAIFFQKHAAVLKILLGPHGMASFEQKLKVQMWQRVRMFFAPEENYELKLLGSLSIIMLIHILKESLLKSNNLDIKNALILLHSVIEQGVYKTAQKYESKHNQMLKIEDSFK